MKIIWTVVADCDPSPSDDYVQMRGMDLDDALGAAVADFLMDAGAGFAIDVSARVVPGPDSTKEDS